MKKRNAIPEAVVESFFSDITSTNNVRLQIIITGGYLELLVNTLTEHKCKTNAAKKCNYGLKLVLLYEMKVISESSFRILDAFRELRNEAAHVAQFTLTNEMLAPFDCVYSRNALPVKKSLNNLGHLCYLILGVFWNEHVKFFHPYFNPELVAEMKSHKAIVDSLSGFDGT